MASLESEFSFFSKLPAEVRAQIWVMSFISRAGRMVEVRNHEPQHLQAQDFDSTGNARLHLWSPSPPPQIANVCHEARDVAKRVAMKAGHFHFQRIFFNPTIDTLYIPMMERESPAAQLEEDHWSTVCHQTILSELEKSIRLDHVCSYARDLEAGNTFGLRNDLRRLTDLKKITFVVPSHHALPLQHQSTYFQYARRMVSSLAAQDAFRATKAGHVRRYPKVEVCRLAIRSSGKFTLVDPTS